MKTLKYWSVSVVLGILALFLMAVFSFAATKLTNGGAADFYQKLLFLWFAVSGSIVWCRIRKMKKSKGAFWTRTIFIWGVVALGWLLFAISGDASFFEVSLVISSILLAYEFIIIPLVYAASS